MFPKISIKFISSLLYLNHTALNICCQKNMSRKSYFERLFTSNFKALIIKQSINLSLFQVGQNIKTTQKDLKIFKPFVYCLSLRCSIASFLLLFFYLFAHHLFFKRIFPFFYCIAIFWSCCEEQPRKILFCHERYESCLS